MGPLIQLAERTGVSVPPIGPGRHDADRHDQGPAGGGPAEGRGHARPGLGIAARIPVDLLGARCTDSERIVGGEFTGRAPPALAPIPISVEDGLARDLQLKLGDEIGWDVQGVPMRTRVTSLRAVEWRRLEGRTSSSCSRRASSRPRPKSYLVAIRAATAADSACVQRAVAGCAFGNVTAIDLALLLDTLDTLFAKVAFVVDFPMALFTVATGLVGPGRRGGRRPLPAHPRADAPAHARRRPPPADPDPAR